ncbi:hypothetical protein [Crossiella sp. CA198]|uniref:hypothetical protein n=1 Tax=Crossiella sp. CA198 TaxID=3455607 RepID=UPI003F8CFF8E
MTSSGIGDARARLLAVVRADVEPVESGEPDLAPQHEQATQCHAAVMQWLVRADLLDAETCRRWKRGADNIGVASKAFFGSGTPRLATKVTGPDQVFDMPGGMIVGFFEHDRLVHTMVSLGNGRLAGVRGANFGAKTLDCEVITLTPDDREDGQFSWNEDGIRWNTEDQTLLFESTGGYRCELRFQEPDCLDHNAFTNLGEPAEVSRPDSEGEPIVAGPAKKCHCCTLF